MRIFTSFRCSRASARACIQQAQLGERCDLPKLARAGYIGSVGLLETIQRVVRTLRAANPDLVYVCDPVLGDDGRLYLPGEMVRLYRDRLVQLATVLTPNQFEAEQLTGNTIRTEHEALQACQDLLERGPSTVVCSFLAS